MSRLAAVILLAGVAMLLAGAAPATGPATRPAIVWGEAHEGVQSAIVNGQTRFEKGRRVGFTVSVRNIGKRDLFVVRSQETCQIEVDGKWYQYFGDVDVKSSALPPGREYHDIHVWLDADWAPMGEPAKFRLAPGRHTLRVAVIAQNEQLFEPVARAVTPPLEFEVE